MKRVATLLLVGALLTGCASASAGTSAPLAGSQWRLLAIDGKPAADFDSARLTFTGDEVGASVGCNRIGGSYRVEKDRLIAGPLMQTQMYCEGPVWEQEQALSALLVGAPRIAVEKARLMLTSSGHKAEFARIGG